MSWNLSAGCVDGWRTQTKVAYGDAHTRDSIPLAMLCVVRKLVLRRDLRHIAGCSKDVTSTRWSPISVKFDSHSRGTAGAGETIITGMISYHTPLIMLQWLSLPPWSSHSPVVYTWLQVKYKGPLFERPQLEYFINMILSLATYNRNGNWVLF